MMSILTLIKGRDFSQPPIFVIFSSRSEGRRPLSGLRSELCEANKFVARTSDVPR